MTFHVYNCTENYPHHLHHDMTQQHFFSRTVQLVPGLSCALLANHAMHAPGSLMVHPFLYLLN